MKGPILALALGAAVALTAGVAWAKPSCGASLYSRCYCPHAGGRYALKAKVLPGSGTTVSMTGGQYGTSSVPVGASTRPLITNTVANSTAQVTVIVSGPNCKTTVTTFSASTPNLPRCDRCP